MSKCIVCRKTATWIRHTQFAGSHPFCGEHARAGTDFGEFNTYMDWEKLNNPLKGKKQSKAASNP